MFEDVRLNLTFTVNGSSAITWNTAVAGQCELADGDGEVINNAVFTSGSVTALGAQITTQPAAALSLNAGASGSLSVAASGATGYQWQVSVGGGAWTNLTNGGGYSGVTTSTLGIVASSAMNANQYRVLVSGGSCADVASSASTLTICLSQVGINGDGDICVGGVTQLSTTVAGGVWSSSNSSIASVSASSGVVTGHSAGSVSIVYTITGLPGCPDVVASVTIAVNAHTAATLNATICAPAVYSFNGQTLNTSGVYTSTLTNAAGCDSVVTLNLTVTHKLPPTFSPTRPTMPELSGITTSCTAVLRESEGAAGLSLSPNTRPRGEARSFLESCCICRETGCSISDKTREGKTPRAMTRIAKLPATTRSPPRISPLRRGNVSRPTPNITLRYAVSVYTAPSTTPSNATNAH